MPHNFYFKITCKIIVFCFMLSEVKLLFCEEDLVLKQPLTGTLPNVLPNIQIPSQSLNVNPNNPETIVTGEGIEVTRVGKNIFILMGNGTIYETISSLINVIPNDNVKIHISNKTYGNIGLITNLCNLTFPHDGAKNNIILATKPTTIWYEFNDSVFIAGDKIVLNTENLYFPEIPVPSNQIAVAALCIDASGKVYKVRNLPVPSASRYKDKIQPIQKESKDIYRLNVVSYEYKDFPGVIEYGFIADDLHEKNIFRNALRYNENGEVDAISYTTITVAAIKEIQELKQEIEYLKEEIIFLKNNYKFN
jgi:hypothetical protein